MFKTKKNTDKNQRADRCGINMADFQSFEKLKTSLSIGFENIRAKVVSIPR